MQSGTNGTEEMPWWIKGKPIRNVTPNTANKAMKGEIIAN
jgi:hypothetical protein